MAFDSFEAIDQHESWRKRERETDRQRYKIDRQIDRQIRQIRQTRQINQIRQIDR